MTPDSNTGRIEYKVTDLVAVVSRLDSLEAADTEQDNELEDHEDRITALENSGNEVEATVI